MTYHPEHPSSLKCNCLNGYVMEHRYVVEKYLGRILRDDEIVHHIDGNKRNNAIENLMVMTQSEHAKLHARLRKQGVRR